MLLLHERPPWKLTFSDLTFLYLRFASPPLMGPTDSAGSLPLGLLVPGHGQVYFARVLRGMAYNTMWEKKALECRGRKGFSQSFYGLSGFEN